jgi:hypothetical protein
MQQPLMLHRYLGRRRQRRHRFDTAPSFARQQARAIVVQRRHPANMTDHARQFADISRKTLDPSMIATKSIPLLPPEMSFCNYLILNHNHPRPFDSVS